MAKFAIHIMSTTTQRERRLNSIKEEMSEFIKKHVHRVCDETKMTKK